METGNRFGGSRMSRVTGGLAPEEELDEFYDDRSVSKVIFSEYFVYSMVDR